MGSGTLSDDELHMQLTPGQLRKAVRLSKETLRHWRQILPAIQSQRGRSPAFSPGDAVALSVLRALTDNWGVKIGRLQKVSKEIFRLCNATPWVALEVETLIIDMANSSCKLVRTTAGIAVDDPVLLCPLKSFMQPLREEFLRIEPSALQGQLCLRPVAIKRQRANGRRS